MPEPRTVTIELLDEIQDGFNRHDVDAILSHFADDCEWLMARGPDPWEARRLKGKAAIGEVLQQVKCWRCRCTARSWEWWREADS